MYFVNICLCSEYFTIASDKDICNFSECDVSIPLIQTSSSSGNLPLYNIE